jgi:hypothetical protein
MEHAMQINISAAQTRGVRRISLLSNLPMDFPLHGYSGQRPPAKMKALTNPTHPGSEDKDFEIRRFLHLKPEIRNRNSHTPNLPDTSPTGGIGFRV